MSGRSSAARAARFSLSLKPSLRVKASSAFTRCTTRSRRSKPLPQRTMGGGFRAQEPGEAPSPRAAPPRLFPRGSRALISRRVLNPFQCRPKVNFFNLKVKEKDNICIQAGRVQAQPRIRIKDKIIENLTCALSEKAFKALLDYHTNASSLHSSKVARRARG